MGEKDHYCSLLAPVRGDLSATRHPVRTGVALFRILLGLVDVNPEVVFVQAHPILLVPVLLYGHSRSNRRIVFTFHTRLDELDARSTRARVIEFLLCHCRAVTFVSSYLRKETERQLRIPSAVRKEVIYPGVPPLTESPEERGFIEALVRGHTPVLTYVGTMEWPAKVEGLSILLGAMVEVRKKLPRVILLVAGGGRYLDEVKRRLVSLGLQDNVALLGNIRNPAPIYLASGLHLHISLMESFGLTLIEAMSVGVPVIGSDIPPLREIVRNGETGVLVNSNAWAVAHAVLDLLASPETAKSIGIAGQRHVLETFTWSRTTSELLGAAGLRLTKGG